MSRTEPFLRTPQRVTGALTAEEKIRMDDHARLWIRRAFRTDPIALDKITPAIHGLYVAANLKTPRVIVVPSPLVMAVAGGFAAALLHAEAKGQITRAATRAATRDATGDATWAATWDATWDATWAATGDATGDATRAATGDATWDATWDATGDGWAREMAVQIAGPELAPFLLSCVGNWANCTDYGNMWSAWPAYLSAFRDVLGLQLPIHEKFAAFEQAAIEGGLRFMHPEFCLVCDFPEVLLVDEQNRPHCADGPSHRWRDGWSLYHWHGVRIAEYIIERPQEITVELIDREPNAEIRRVMIERYGMARYLLDGGAKVLSHDGAGILYRKEIPGDEALVMVRVLNSTPEPDGVMDRDEAIAIFGEAAKAAVDAPSGSRFKEYSIRVPPTVTSAREAVAWTFGLAANEYAPELET